MSGNQASLGEFRRGAALNSFLIMAILATDVGMEVLNVNSFLDLLSRATLQQVA